jgi:uncharacterized membrane protein required for colicin V production
MNLAFQFLDVAVVLIILASAVYATYRGFVSESLAVFGWIAAAYATLYFGPWVAWWMRDMLKPQWLGEAAGYVLVFLVVLIPLQFASSRISQNIKKSQVGTVDSVLGTGFGILRGVAIIGIAYLVFVMYAPCSQPSWLVNARLFPAIHASAEVVASLIPDQKVRAPKDPCSDSRESARSDRRKTQGNLVRTAQIRGPAGSESGRTAADPAAQSQTGQACQEDLWRQGPARARQTHRNHQQRRERQAMSGLTAPFAVEDADSLHEECGVFGIFGHPGAGALTVLGLHALQHRGQEAAGIVSYDRGQFIAERHPGLVGDIFGKNSAHAANLKGEYAIGHNRYSTAGGSAVRNIQPLFAD